MAANLENSIQEKVRTLPPEKQQRVLSLVEELLSEESAQRSNRPFWEIAREITAQVPAEDWQKLPSDGAEEHDYYLYGSPKKN